MRIINNQYRSICRPSTSVTRRALGLNASIRLSISCGILFHSSTMASFEESRSVILRPRYTCCSRVPGLQNLLDSNLDYSVANDGAPVIKVVFLCVNISRVSLALAPSCMNKYPLCFASLFISGIFIFFNNTLQ